MYADVNWSDRKVDAAIQILNGLISKGADPNLSVRRSIHLANKLIKQLKKEQSEEDNRIKAEFDELLESE